MFFMTGLAKLLAITALFFAVNRLAGIGVIFFIQGLMMVYVGIAGVGLRRLAAGKRHGT